MIRIDNSLSKIIADSLYAPIGAYLTSLTTSTPTNLTGFIKGNGSVLSADNSTYQLQLISATNIKTINSNSILGSGDLVISSGAPTDATYIVQTANAGLSAEQVLGTLGTGILYNTTTTGVLSIATNVFPQRATMWHGEATVITGNALTLAIDTASMFNYAYYQNPCANGDSFSNSFFLKAGTYTLSVLGLTANSYGKIDWYIDGVKVVSLQDWYSSSTTKNVIKTASVTVVGDGYHQLIGTINGHNGSTSSPHYNMALTAYWLKPTADEGKE